MPNEPVLDQVEKLQRSSRDVTTLPAVMSQWLSTVLPGVFPGGEVRDGKIAGVIRRRQKKWPASWLKLHLSPADGQSVLINHAAFHHQPRVRGHDRAHHKPKRGHNRNPLPKFLHGVRAPFTLRREGPRFPQT